MKIILIPLLAAYIALALLIILQGIAQAQVYPGEDAGLSIRLDNRSNRIDNFGGYGGRGYGRDNYGGYRHHGYGFGLGNDVDIESRTIDLIPPASPYITHIKPPWGGSTTSSQ